MKSYPLKLDDSLYEQIQYIISYTKSTTATFIREAIIAKVEQEKNSLSYKLNTLSSCNKLESSEILATIKTLNNDDSGKNSNKQINLNEELKEKTTATLIDFIKGSPADIKFVKGSNNPKLYRLKLDEYRIIFWTNEQNQITVTNVLKDNKINDT